MLVASTATGGVVATGGGAALVAIVEDAEEGALEVGVLFSSDHFLLVYACEYKQSILSRVKFTTFLFTT